MVGKCPVSSRREMNRARLEATLQWLGETIGGDVEGYHAEMLSSVAKDVGKLRFIRDGAAYECDIVLRAVRVLGPSPEPDPGPVLELAREITITVACDHGIERGRFCKACDEEQ